MTENILLKSSFSFERAAILLKNTMNNKSLDILKRN